MEPYETLAEAIIKQAVYDYKVAIKKLRKNEKNEIALSDKEECEKFFRSPWFESMTSISGEMIIERLSMGAA